MRNVIQNVTVLTRHTGRIFRKSLTVGLGEIAFCESDLKLRVPALGPCIALVIYPRHLPREARIATMAHILYPTSTRPINPGQNIISDGKYADIAFDVMFDNLLARGYHYEDLAAKMTGGVDPTSEQIPKQSWYQNAPAVQTLLKKAKIPLIGSYVGGSDRIEAIFNVKEYKFYLNLGDGQRVII